VVDQAYRGKDQGEESRRTSPRHGQGDHGALPIVDDVSDLPSSVPPEARALIGQWFNHGTAQPCRTRSPWARTPRHRASFWSETIRLRLATQVQAVRHWRVIEGDYSIATNRDAHWHIDPYPICVRHPATTRGARTIQSAPTTANFAFKIDRFEHPLIANFQLRRPA
jgi:hypothetical protein